MKTCRNKQITLFPDHCYSSLYTVYRTHCLGVATVSVWWCCSEAVQRGLARGWCPLWELCPLWPPNETNCKAARLHNTCI